MTTAAMGTFRPGNCVFRSKSQTPLKMDSATRATNSGFSVTSAPGTTGVTSTSIPPLREDVDKLKYPIQQDSQQLNHDGEKRHGKHGVDEKPEAIREPGKQLLNQRYKYHGLHAPLKVHCQNSIFRMANRQATPKQHRKAILSTAGKAFQTSVTALKTVVRYAGSNSVLMISDTMSSPPNSPSQRDSK